MHVRKAGLLLRLGFRHVDGVGGTYKEVWEIECGQAIVAQVAHAGKIVPVLADFAEGFDFAVGLCPYDEGPLQATAARTPTLSWIDALGDIHRGASAKQPDRGHRK